MTRHLSGENSTDEAADSSTKSIVSTPSTKSIVSTLSTKATGAAHLLPY
jgi:hypothetical protein